MITVLIAKPMKHIYGLLACFMFMGQSNAQVNKTGLNWDKYMERQTLHWDSISTNYYTGILLGNGLLGTNIYKEDNQAIRFDIGRTDVTDQREYPKEGSPAPLINRPRLPIGRMLLKTSGTITGAKMQLDIYNAIASGTVYTTKGEIQFSCFVPSEINVICIQVKGSKGEQQIDWQFAPEKSISPRMLQNNNGNPAQYTENPLFEIKKQDGYSVCHQLLLNKGGYATVWKEQKSTGQSSMLVSVGYDKNGRFDEIKEATSAIDDYLAQKEQTVLNQHRNWWHRYYQQSFISIPDQRMESFYWMQFYKLASATRANKPMIDLMGPWFTSKTPWPGIWWNLNTQLTYSPIFTSGHMEIGRSLFNTLNQNTHNLINNVPQEWRNDAATIGRVSSYDLVSPLGDAKKDNGQLELGNLTWTLFYYYQYYAYSADRQELQKYIYPLLKRSVNYLLHQLKKDENGVYHLPSSFSPEYKSAEDANYALSNLRWGLKILMDLDSKEGIKDADRPKWEEISKNLVAFPVNDTGLMIGKDVSLTSSHRHYSHMLMIYPYHLINWDQVENRPLIEQSLNHWLSLKGALQGYTFTGGASINAMMGRGNEANELLGQLFDKYIRPNTLYQESGPVIETPLSAATTIQEMLLQSWGGKIRVFPAVPAQWKDAAFDRLLAEGAFTVSAKRENGATTFIRIWSTNGDTCRVQTDMKVNKVSSDKRKQVAFTALDKEGLTNLVFSTIKGETITLSSSTQTNITSILPVPISVHEGWSWGLKKHL